MRRLIILSVIIALTLVPEVGMTQTNWEKYPANPVFDLSKGGRWDDVYVLHPSVVFDGSKFHLWYAGDSGSHSNIGYAWSEDGIVWEKYTGNPVLEDGAGRVWDGEFVTHPSVLYDGVQYRMWYAGYDGTNMRIGYAASADGIVWNKHDTNPVLDLGASGSWDAMGVSGPTVFLDGNTYRMWYTGYDGINTRIGYATSADGVVWNKHASNPVLDLGVSGSWDAIEIINPTVLLDGNTYRMWYTGYDGTSMRIGYAASADGIVWNKYDTNPVLNHGAGGSWDVAGVSSPTVVLENGNYRMWYTGYDRANGKIGLSYTGCAGVMSESANVTAHAHANPATYEATSPGGAEVTLDGSGSIGSDGNPITDEAAYEWDFEYDGTFQPDATGKTVTNVYFIGEHTAALRVTDSGESSIDTVNIKVEDTRPPIVKLLSPHGGEVYQGGIDVAILWESATDIVSQNNNAIALYYNVDGGDWQLISDNETNDGQYDWTVPTLDSANVKVKIEVKDATGNVGNDASSEGFIIDSQSPLVELIAPNGGEVMRGGTVFPITWKPATDNLSLTDILIHLSYSADGTNWSLIAEGERNDGQFDWNIPALDSENLLVRVEAFDRAGNVGEDISDNPFSVDNTAPTVVLTYPNGGETLRGGDNINITWEPAVDTHLADNPISLFYSLVGLDGWIPIAQNLPNNGSYTWSIPRVNSQLVHIKVVAIDLVDNIGEDISDAEFTIDSNAPVSLLTLINPSKEQTQYLRGGSIYTIVWALPQDNFSLADVALNYSADGGNSWNPIAQVIDAGTIYGRYDWNVPAIDSNQVVIRIEATDASGNRTEDTSGNHVIDSSAPEAPAFTPIDSPTSQNVLTITGTAEAESQVSLLHNLNPIVSVQADASGNFNFTIEPLTDGLHSFTATAADAAGNVSPPSTPMEVMVDTVAPCRPIPVSPADGISVNISPTLVWEAISDATAVTYHVQVDDEAGFTSPQVDVSEIAVTQYVLTLSDGIWFWRVKASDAVGHVSDFSPVYQFTLDTIAPDAPIITSPETGTILGETKLTISGVAGPESRVDIYDNEQMLGSDIADAEGNFALPVQGLAEGEHTFTAKATDAAGNSSNVSESVTLVVDITKPEPPVFSSPADGAVTNQNVLILTGTAEVGSTITLLDNGEILGTSTTDISGAFSYTTRLLADGTHSFTATATDMAGNFSDASAATTVTVDTNSPVPPVFLSPTSGTVTNQDALTVEGTAEAMSIVTLLDNGEILGVAVANVSGVFGYTTPSLADGSHNFTATATDAAGNVSNVSAVTAVTVDTVKPATPLLLSPSSGTVTNQDVLTVEGTAEAMSIVTLLDNGEILGTAVADVSGVFGYTTPSLADGNHNFTATATDVAGNVSDVSADTTVIVDTSSLAPPVLLSPSSGTITNQDVLILTGTAEVGSTITLLDNEEILGTAPTDTNGSFNYTTRALADGIHSFTATATDVAGNVSDSSPATTVTVDTTAPTLSVSLDKQEYTTNESVLIIYTAADNLDDPLSVTMTITPELTVSSDNRILPPLPVGSLTVTVTATDDAGNSSIANASAFVKALVARLDVTPNLFEIQIPKKSKTPKEDEKTVLLTGYLMLPEELSLSEINTSSLRLNDSIMPKNTIAHDSVLEMQFEVDRAFVASLLSLDVALIDKLEQNANSIRVFLNTPVAMASITLGMLQVTGVLNDQVAFASEDASRHIALKEAAAPVATRSFLAQNYPNPFNPETWLPYALASDAYVIIRIFDVCGNLVRCLNLGYRETGFYTERGEAAHWDGRDSLGQKVASGVYFYTLRAGEFTATRKMVILK